MNKKKLEVVKKILDIDNWYIKEDKRNYPESIFVFDGDGRCIIQRDNKKSFLYHNEFIGFKLKYVININNQEVEQLMKFLMEKYFGWEMTLLPDKTDCFMLFTRKQTISVEEYFKSI